MPKIKIKPRPDPPKPDPPKPALVLASVPTDLLLAELGRRQVRRVDRPLASLRAGERFRCLPGQSNRDGVMVEVHQGCCCKVLVTGEGGRDRTEYWSERAMVVPTGEIAAPRRQAIAGSATPSAERVTAKPARHTEVLTRREQRVVTEHAAATLQVTAPKSKRVEL